MFIKEGSSINTVVTSKEAILKTCREIVSENGLPALNMRTVAKRCNVALGSIYNYFHGKDELVLATIESVWKDIFHMDHPGKTELSFSGYVAWVYKSVQNGTREYPNFFTAHSISFASDKKSRAKDMMEKYFDHIKAGMANALSFDSAVQPDIFSPAFSESDFIDFVFSNLLLLLVQQKENCDFLLEIINRILYQKQN